MNPDSMDSVSILEKIIQEEGSCTWSKPSICAKCPLGRSTRDKNGEYMSCVESLSIDGLKEEEADARYKKAAQEKLADLVIDEIIRSK
jgi:hypothetical protein